MEEFDVVMKEFVALGLLMFLLWVVVMIIALSLGGYPSV